MLVYVSSFAFSLIFAHFAQYSEQYDNEIEERPTTNGVLVLFSFLPLFIVSAIRYEVGTDYSGTYKQIYDYTYADGYHFRISGEPLYGFTNSIASLYSGPDYVGVFVLSSLLVCGFTFIAIRRQSSQFFYCVLIFIISGFYFWSFNAVRQMIAMAIFLFSLQYVQKQKPVRFFFWILIAYGFHTTALLYLPVYLLRKVRIDFRVMAVLAVVWISLASVLRQMANSVTSFIPIFNIYAARYLNDPVSDSNESSPALAFINFAFLLLYIVIASIYDKHQEKSRFWINLQFLAFAFSSLASTLPLASRIGRLFTIAQVLSIPFMTNLISDKKTRHLIITVIVICYSVYCLVTFYILGYHDVFPYQTIFNRGPR